MRCLDGAMGSLVVLVSVVANSVLIEVGGFFRVREKPEVRLPLSDGKSRALALCDSYDVACTSKKIYTQTETV